MIKASKQDLVEALGLEPHVEGGYFRRTYEAQGLCDAGGQERRTMTSIFYLLTEDSPVGHLHCNQSDIVHYFHGGGTLRYWLLDPGGALRTVDLGWRLDRGQQLQLTVPGGVWKASRLLDGAWGLISEAVSPGWDPADMAMISESMIRDQHPQHLEALRSQVRG